MRDWCIQPAAAHPDLRLSNNKMTSSEESCKTTPPGKGQQGFHPDSNLQQSTRQHVNMARDDGGASARGGGLSGGYEWWKPMGGRLSVRLSVALTARTECEWLA